MEVAVRRAQQLQEGIKRLSVQHGKEYLNAPTISWEWRSIPTTVPGEVLLRAAVKPCIEQGSGRDRLIVGQATEMD